MRNNEIKVVIQANAHANLDSFPFRFGYSFPQDTVLTVRNYEQVPDKEVHDNKRMGINGYFTLPNDTTEYKAKFILIKTNNNVVTVIRKDQWFDTEHKLSEMLRRFRENGDIGVRDNIEMFKKGVKSADDLVKYLGGMLSKDKIEAVEMEAQHRVEQFKQQIDNLVGNLRDTNKEKEVIRAQRDETIEDLVHSKETIAQKDEALAQKDEALTQKDEEIRRLSKAGNVIDSSKNGAPRVVNNTFKVLDAGMGNKGKYNQPAVYLDIEDGHSTPRIWNNWGRGQAARLALGQALIGEEITYDTWGDYNDEWFYHLHKVLRS